MGIKVMNDQKLRVRKISLNFLLLIIYIDQSNE